MPWYLRVAERLHLARLLRSLRYDTRYLPATERASDDDGLRMLALAVHARRYDFDLQRMPRDRVGADRGRRVQRVLRRRQPRAPIAGRGRSASSSRPSTRHAAAIEELWHAADGPVLLP